MTPRLGKGRKPKNSADPDKGVWPRVDRPRRASSDNTWPAVLPSRRASSLAANSTSSAMSNVVLTHQMLLHQLPMCQCRSRNGEPSAPCGQLPGEQRHHSSGRWLRRILDRQLACNGKQPWISHPRRSQQRLLARPSRARPGGRHTISAFFRLQGRVRFLTICIGLLDAKGVTVRSASAGFLGSPTGGKITLVRP